MKKKTTRIITLLLAIIMCLGTTLPVAAAENEDAVEYDLSIRAYYNLASTRRVVVDNEEMRLSNGSYIDLSAINVDGDYYEGFGTVEGEESFSIVFSGELKTKTVKAISNGIEDDTVDALIGVLTGCVVETEELITLSIHSIPTNGYSYIFMSVGATSETEISKTYIFGTVFNEMIELVDSESQSVEDVTEESEIIASDNGIMMADLIDYDPIFQITAYSQYEKGFTGEYLPMVAVTLYSPNRVYCNGVYPAFVKINASNNNMLIYLRGRYYGVLSASYSSGSCSIYAPSSSINDHVDFSRPDPEDDNFNITLNVPSWAFGKLSKIIDIIPITFNIFFNTVKVKLSKNSGTLYDNKVVWNHNYHRDLTWTDSSPSETTNGYTGRIMMTYMKNTNAGQMFTISATGHVNFTFTGNDAGVPFNGSGTFNAPVVTKGIYIDSNAS